MNTKNSRHKLRLPKRRVTTLSFATQKIYIVPEGTTTASMTDRATTKEGYEPILQEADVKDAQDALRRVPQLVSRNPTESCVESDEFTGSHPGWAVRLLRRKPCHWTRCRVRMNDAVDVNLALGE